MPRSPSKPLRLVPEEWSDRPRSAIAALIAADAPVVTVDCSLASSVPAQAAQILLAAKRHMEERGAELRLDPLPDGVAASLRALGLGELVGEARA